MGRAQESAARGIDAALGEVRAVYAELDTRPVERACTLRTECCHFAITGRIPHLTLGEALLAARAFRATGRKRLRDPIGGACPLLHPETLRCLSYADRPFGCRTHFCDAAGGPVSRRAVLDLIRRLEHIDVRLGGQGPRALAGALVDALARE